VPKASDGIVNTLRRFDIDRTVFSKPDVGGGGEFRPSASSLSLSRS
jgi:hypothetical protein